MHGLPYLHKANIDAVNAHAQAILKSDATQEQKKRAEATLEKNIAESLAKQKQK